MNITVTGQQCPVFCSWKLHNPQPTVIVRMVICQE